MSAPRWFAFWGVGETALDKAGTGDQERHLGHAHRHQNGLARGVRLAGEFR